MNTERLDALAKCAMHRDIVKSTPSSKIINVYLSQKKENYLQLKMFGVVYMIILFKIIFLSYHFINQNHHLFIV